MALDYTRFMVLGQGRSGTTMLVQALNSLPSVVCFGEIFNASTSGIEFGVTGYESTQRDVDLRAGNPRGFLQARIFCEHGSEVRAVGFKFGYDHFWRHEGLVEILAEDRNLKVIHLRRLNRLRTYVSLKIAEASGRWFEYAPEPSLRSRLSPRTLLKTVRHPSKAATAIRRRLAAHQPIETSGDAKRDGLTVDAEDFAEFCRRGEYSEMNWEEILSGHQIMRLTYEDLAVDRDHELSRVQKFLGLEPQPTEVALRKQNPEALSELIANYDELRSAFVGSAYEAFFDD